MPLPSNNAKFGANPFSAGKENPPVPDIVKLHFPASLGKGDLFLKKNKTKNLKQVPALKVTIRKARRGGENIGI